MTSKLALTGIHHVAVICSDYAVSKKFYTETLGGKIIHEVFRAERKSWKLDIQLGDGIQIELFSFEGAPPRASRPEACGLRHLALKTSDIHRAVEFLKGNNISVEEIRTDEYTGRLFTFFADPDGLPLELYEQG